jgi:hypothetical protein
MAGATFRTQLAISAKTKRFLPYYRYSHTAIKA